jgi:hypothetical protein
VERDTLHFNILTYVHAVPHDMVHLVYHDTGLWELEGLTKRISWLGCWRLHVSPRVRKQSTRAFLLPELLLLLVANILTPHLTGIISTPLAQELE